MPGAALPNPRSVIRQTNRGRRKGPVTQLTCSITPRRRFQPCWHVCGDRRGIWLSTPSDRLRSSVRQKPGIWTARLRSYHSRLDNCSPWVPSSQRERRQSRSRTVPHVREAAWWLRCSNEMRDRGTAETNTDDWLHDGLRVGNMVGTVWGKLRNSIPRPTCTSILI